MRIRKNPQLLRQLRKHPGVRVARRAAAEAVKRKVQAVAPRGGTGDYAGSVRVYDDGDDIGVETTDFAGHIIEFGSVNNPPYAPLRRGARAAGLRLEEQPKQ